MTIKFIDIKTEQRFTIEENKVEYFQDTYINPQNLICVDEIYCDGSGFNGLVSRIAYGNKNLMKQTIYREPFTNNEMEYQSLIHAIGIAKKWDIIYSDSQLIVFQVLGQYKVHDKKLIPLNILATKEINRKHIKIMWIPREQNIAGKYLDKQK